MERDTHLTFERGSMIWHFVKSERWLLSSGITALLISGLVYFYPVKATEVQNYGTVPLWITPIAYFALALFMGFRQLRCRPFSLIAVVCYVLSGYLYLFPTRVIGFWHPLLVPVIAVFFAGEEEAHETTDTVAHG